MLQKGWGRQEVCSTVNQPLPPPAPRSLSPTSISKGEFLLSFCKHTCTYRRAGEGRKAETSSSIEDFASTLPPEALLQHADGWQEETLRCLLFVCIMLAQVWKGLGRRGSPRQTCGQVGNSWFNQWMNKSLRNGCAALLFSCPILGANFPCLLQLWEYVQLLKKVVKKVNNRH